LLLLDNGGTYKHSSFSLQYDVVCSLSVLFKDKIFFLTREGTILQSVKCFFVADFDECSVCFAAFVAPIMFEKWISVWPVFGLSRFVMWVWDQLA
jgi:hypothetical protein